MLSVEPDAELDLTTVRSWTELKSRVRCFTDWTIQLPQRKILIYQVVRMTHSVDTSQPLSQRPLSSPSGLLDKVAMVAVMALYMFLATCICIHQGWSGFGHCWLPNLPTTETNIEPLYMAPLLKGHQPATMVWGWLRLFTLNCFPYGRNRHSGYRFAFAIYNAFPNCPPWSSRMPYLPLWYSTQHCFWSRNSFHSKWSVALGQWNSLIILCSPTSWSSWLDEQWHGLLKTQLQCQVPYLVGLEPGSPEGCICSESPYGAVFPIARIHRSRIKRWKWSGTTYNYP